jgi:hypothetical protein
VILDKNGKVAAVVLGVARKKGKKVPTRKRAS